MAVVSAVLMVVVGVLAVMRSLGDSSMKDYVIGSPYTTKMELCDVDKFLIIQFHTEDCYCGKGHALPWCQVS